MRATLITTSMLLYSLSEEAQIQGHKNTVGLFSVRTLLPLSIFAYARSYGELIGIRHASRIFCISILDNSDIYILEHPFLGMSQWRSW